jgi:hypothetical protein
MEANRIRRSCFFHTLCTFSCSELAENKREKSSGNEFVIESLQLTQNRFGCMMDVVPRGTESSKPGRGSGPGTMIRRWAMDSRLPAPGSEGNIGPIAKASFSRLASAERYDPKGRTS